MRTVSTINSRSKGLTCRTAQRRRRLEAKPGRRYSVRIETAPGIRIRCVVRAGTQMAKAPVAVLEPVVQ